MPMIMQQRGSVRESECVGENVCTVHLRRLGLHLWVLGLLAIANVSMFLVLVLGNLRAPAIAGPVGLAFMILCLFSIVLAYLTHRAATGVNCPRVPHA